MARDHGQGRQARRSGFDSEKFGGDLFTLDYKDGTAVITATDAYRALVSADVEHENDWTAYIQCKRIKTAGRVENRFTEHFNDKGLESNVVWTRTPDMTPSLHLEKYDVKSGERLGDRDDVKQALKMDGDSLEIAFKITNTSKVDSSTGEGAWFRARTSSSPTTPPANGRRGLFHTIVRASSGSSGTSKPEPSRRPYRGHVIQNKSKGNHHVRNHHRGRQRQRRHQRVAALQPVRHHRRGLIIAAAALFSNIAL